MYCTRKLQDDLIFVGANDRRLALFENVFPIPRGVSYNAYVLLDDKTVLLDTVDASVSGQFFENLAHALDGRPLDYVVVNHMEPDHCAALAETLRRYPMAQLVCNAKAAAMVGQFFDESLAAGARIVKEGDTLCTGRHTLTFVMAPMVHWPEAMVTYDAATHTLFSADAFGTFGAMPGCVFADEVAFERDWMADARRYYTNIVGKYGTQVQALLKKAAALDIDMICPLHGPVWRCGIDGILDKYDRWSTYTPEENAVLIAYASVYGGTEAAAQALSSFEGVRRRFTHVGDVRGVTLVDDYGHHPTEIAATLNAASSLDFKHVDVVFQPHRYSRLQALADDFADAFAQADKLILIDVFPAGEMPIPGVTSKMLADLVAERHPGKRVLYAPDRATLMGYLDAEVEEGDLLITMGAGDVTQVGPEYLDHVAEANRDGR